MDPLQGEFSIVTTVMAGFLSAAQDLPSGFLLAMPVLAAEVQGNQGGVVQFRAFNAGEELKAFLFLGFFVLKGFESMEDK